ncbi:MAG: SPOR domain-containing protein [Bacteroidota bacterium]
MKNASVYSATFSFITGCIFFIIIFVSISAQAQTRGTVEVIKDARIDTLAARITKLKSTSTASAIYSTSDNGYRVQIYNGSSRKEAYAAQERFNNAYPEMRSYISYTEPNYKIKAGDFRTRLEAEKLMQELKGKFTSLFIMSGKINPPKTTTGND